MGRRNSRARCALCRPVLLQVYLHGPALVRQLGIQKRLHEDPGDPGHTVHNRCPGVRRRAGGQPDNSGAVLERPDHTPASARSDCVPPQTGDWRIRCGYHLVGADFRGRHGLALGGLPSLQQRRYLQPARAGLQSGRVVLRIHLAGAALLAGMAIGRFHSGTSRYLRPLFREVQPQRRKPDVHSRAEDTRFSPGCVDHVCDRVGTLARPLWPLAFGAGRRIRCGLYRCQRPFACSDGPDDYHRGQRYSHARQHVLSGDASTYRGCGALDSHVDHPELRVAGAEPAAYGQSQRVRAGRAIYRPQSRVHPGRVWPGAHRRGLLFRRERRGRRRYTSKPEDDK